MGGRDVRIVPVENRITNSPSLHTHGPYGLDLWPMQPADNRHLALPGPLASRKGDEKEREDI
jgi:hypothetical protein